MSSGKAVVLERHAEEDYVLASWRRLYICVVRLETTRELLERMRIDGPEFAAQHGDRVGLMTVIEASAPPPPASTRSQLAELLRASQYVRASAVVFEGNSFRAAIVRSVATGLSQLSRTSFPFPHRVFADAADAGEWLLAELGGPSQHAEANELRRELRRYREGIDERFPQRR